MMPFDQDGAYGLKTIPHAGIAFVDGGGYLVIYREHYRKKSGPGILGGDVEEWKKDSDEHQDEYDTMRVVTKYAKQWDEVLLLIQEAERQWAKIVEADIVV